MPAHTKPTKKRAAPSQSGPASKKVHLEKPGKASSVPAQKKRARPVVSVREPQTDDSDAEEEKLMEEEEELDGHDHDLEGESLDGDGDGNVDGNVDGDVDMESPQKPKDPNAARESHKIQKALQAERRAAKPHSDLLTEAKRAWSLARQQNIAKGERKKHIAALEAVVKGKYQEIVFKHDASRIVQTVIKYGDQKQRDAVAVELKGRYKELAQNKYSKFLVTKIIRLCPAHRLSILLEFQSHVIRLLLHREASHAIADTFELYANAYERAVLLRDFYGKETTLFSKSTGNESAEEKDEIKKGLKGVLEGVDSERRKRVLSSLKDNLLNIFNNSEKGSVRHAIVHRALWEYLTEVEESPEEEEREKLRREMFENCQDILAEMVHTKDGSRVVREFLARGTAKDRKIIIKTIKPYIETMAIDDEAQLVLFTALDVIDDTKMLAKSLIPSLTAHASTLHKTSQGRRTLLYPLVPRSRRHFTPAMIVSLEETDALREKTSKKDVDVRVAEVRSAASQELLDWVTKDGAAVCRETGGSLIVLEILLEAEGDKTLAMETLLRPLASPYPSEDPSTPHPIDLPHTSRLIKNLLQGGHFSHTTRTVEKSSRFSAKEFAEIFVRLVGKETTLAMAKGSGAFVVAELVERVSAEGSDETKSELKEWIKHIGSAGDEVKGWGVLMEKVEALKV